MEVSGEGGSPLAVSGNPLSASVVGRRNVWISLSLERPAPVTTRAGLLPADGAVGSQGVGSSNLPVPAFVGLLTALTCFAQEQMRRATICGGASIFAASKYLEKSYIFT